MSLERPLAPSPRPHQIANWLLAIAALVFLMVVVGGITRLTESGLSITRWDPISGVIPPLNQADWQHQFDLYKQTPHYQTVHRNMTLSDFQFIFFCEYMHLLLGRLIGVAFALPFAWFAWKRAIPKGFGWRPTIIFALGALQGAIGWWMVVSGLVERTEVSHIRLAVHLLNAFLIIGAVVWVALDLRALARNPAARLARLSGLAILALLLLTAQLCLGAFTAGLRAGYAFNTWPLMGDGLFPHGVPMLEPFWRNVVDNPNVVQFVHRWLAWIVAAPLLILALRTQRTEGKGAAHALLTSVSPQTLSGIPPRGPGSSLWMSAA